MGTATSILLAKKVKTQTKIYAHFSIGNSKRMLSMTSIRFVDSENVVYFIRSMIIDSVQYIINLKICHQRA